MHVEFHVKCMQTNFGGHALSGFTDFAPFIFGQIFVLCVFSSYFSHDNYDINLTSFGTGTCTTSA